MNEPIQAGDLCEVIDGAKGKDSPNLGLIVSVLSFTGEHPVYGRMWRCEAEYGEADPEQMGKASIPPGVLDFAQPWLKKLPKKPTPPAQKTAPKELEKI